MDYVVYTGDIVGSSELPEARRKQLTTLIEQASSAVKASFGAGALPLPIDVFRGDSWQFYTPLVGRAVQIALFLTSWLLANSDGTVRTRVSVGVGGIDYLPDDRPSAGDGEAYRISGRNLEQMASRDTFSIAVPERYGTPAALLVTASGRLIDHISSRWTAGQSLAVAFALAGKTQPETARQWRPRPITQQGVAQHLSRAGWDHLGPAVTEIDRSLAHLSEHV